MLHATIAWSTHLNGLGGKSVDGNRQLLTRLGRVRGNIERLDSDDVIRVSYMAPFSPTGWISRHEKRHTTDGVAPTGRRVSVTGGNNLL